MDGGVAGNAGLCGQSQACQPVDALAETPGDLSKAVAVVQRLGAKGLSLSVERPLDQCAGRGLIYGHHVYPAGSGDCLYGGGYGLEQPVYVVLGAVHDLDKALLKEAVR